MRKIECQRFLYTNEFTIFYREEKFIGRPTETIKSTVKVNFIVKCHRLLLLKIE